MTADARAALAEVVVSLGDVRLPEQFWAKVIEADGYCWEWTGTRNHQGYGEFHYDGQRRRAHRVAYEALVGPIADGLVCDHLCRNPPCVNPTHIEPVTNAENVRRGLSANRETCRAGLHSWPEASFVKGGERLCRECHLERRRRERARAERFQCWLCDYNGVIEGLHHHLRAMHDSQCENIAATRAAIRSHDLSGVASRV